MESGLKGVTTVSINDVRLAIENGIDSSKIIFNGNGKTKIELLKAINYGVIINVDSKFDYDNLLEAKGFSNSNDLVKVLIRVNPNIDPNVHPYISTGLKTSKFGIVESEVYEMAEAINQSKHLSLHGIHCHLGSTISKLEPIRDCVTRMKLILQSIRHLVNVPSPVINVGGGLGIDYHRYKENEYPPISEYVAEFNAIDPDIRLILEPGRSLIANCAILVADVVGVKNENCLVTNMSMTECIRPALYQAYHHVTNVKLNDSVPATEFNVVGPVCESSDFLNKCKTKKRYYDR